MVLQCGEEPLVPTKFVHELVAPIHGCKRNDFELDSKAGTSTWHS